MRKRILNIVMLVSSSLLIQQATAQSSSASQQIEVNLEPTIHISSQSTSNIRLSFDNISSYLNGAESGSQLFNVQSNREFVVNVKTNSSTFTYSGSEYPTPQMPVNNTLFLTVSNNNTGGVIANNFRRYTSLSNTSKDLLLNCANGSNKSFSVNYRAIPGINYPAGKYTVGVTYTATQP